jgi:long-subunit fatty acid transport protein
MKKMNRTEKICASLCVLAGLLALPAAGKEFVISTPLGDIQVDVPHLTPQGAVVNPEAPSVSVFRPPTIFSAPLPSGSGARALGLAGAFTAVADDATAASWNPGGLIQLERPEASFVYRASREHDTHRVDSETMSVGSDSFESYGLNYFSGVLPFEAGKRNFVFSINYQEAYDFAQRFTADFTDRSSRRGGDVAQASESSTFTETYVLPNGEINLTSHITTETTRTLDQVLASEMLTALDYDQQGLIDAVTPAFAVELTPKLSAGGAVNFYGDDLFGRNPIRSTTTARFSGLTDSAVGIAERQMTSGTWSYDGVIHFPPLGNIPGFDVPIPVTEGVYEPFTDATTSRDGDRLYYDGTIVEDNQTDDLNGYNATLGVLWTVSRLLGLGFTVDLPWTAEARQQRTVSETITTYDASRTRVINISETSETETRDVEYRFPLYWAAGTVLRLTDEFYMTMDVSQTLWSDFSFKAEGEERLNPLDGTPYGQNEIGDTWSVRGALEYLLFFPKFEIPLRAGVAWEQRPAIGEPDEFWNFSLGAGLSLGAEPRRVILDVAYLCSLGENALGSLIPGTGMTSDVEEHQVYVSGIMHF